MSWDRPDSDPLGDLRKWKSWIESDELRILEQKQRAELLKSLERRFRPQPIRHRRATNWERFTRRFR